MTSTTDSTAGLYYNEFQNMPMPGDQFHDKGTVIASCIDVVAEEDDNRVSLLILRPTAPYYLVVYTWRANLDAPWENAGGDLYPNIIPASEAYSDLIGGY